MMEPQKKTQIEKREMSESMHSYTNHIQQEVHRAYTCAKTARSKNFDPEQDVDIPLAKNLPERVEGLVSATAPQLKGRGLPKRIEELEKEHGKLDWRVALSISLEVAQQKFCDFSDERKAMETGIRVGLAYLTLGVVASPLEGFVELKLRKRKDNGKKYFALMYSGPIRSAGGTAGAVSVIVADYIRKSMGYEPYDPSEREIRRMITELYDYHDRVTNLQYRPSEKEIMFLIQRLPVQIDGDPSEKIEVSNYKDLERIETNKIRSGVCLVTGECVAQKASKVWAQLSKWGHEFKLDQWNFLKNFITLQKSIKAQQKKGDNAQHISPDYTYIKDLVAGRPVLTHPLAHGGFRLRYGRARTGGYSSGAIHPFTMGVLQKYLAVGTQLKVERPGKATSITSCDSIEGPIVKLAEGSVVHLDSEQKLAEHKNSIQEILFLGDILFSYGDFFNRAHTLIPPGYCEEWWSLQLRKALIDEKKKVEGETNIPKERLQQLEKEPLHSKPSIDESIFLSQNLEIPLHPKYTPHWKSLTKEQFLAFSFWLHTSVKNKGEKYKFVLPLQEEPKRALELIGLQHKVVNNEFVVIVDAEAKMLQHCLNMDSENWYEEIKVKAVEAKDTLDLVNAVSPTIVKDKSGIFIGARMGRPEKAKMRKLTGSPHTLFPVGEEGGRLRSFQSAFEGGVITAEFPNYLCKACNNQTVLSICEKCGSRTTRLYYSPIHGFLEEGSSQITEATATYTKKKINVTQLFKDLLAGLEMDTYPDLIKGVRGTSNKNHIPENPLKGILRAKYDVSVNKDGTTRFDATQLPITHFKPKEIGTSIERLQDLGYTTDIHGKPLENENQICELKPQDIILPACPDSPDPGADTSLLNVAKFIDDLLEQVYHLDSYYKLSSSKELAGHLVMVLAPHTSAGIVGRIIGFSKTQGLFAHPMLHAATRRDCDGDEASVTLLLDGLLNFSRQFLPATRGATQDAPLVLTSRIIPSEVDDMLFDVDVGWNYPLDFYEACENYKKPWEVEVEQFGKRINTSNQYENMGFTHHTNDINKGVVCSSYKTLPSMQEKLGGQMLLADKIRAVDAVDVARLVIEKHLIRDIKGNLRKFSTQQFRCVKCNEKFRRPPLQGICTTCEGKILFTVSEGTVVKYLEPALSLAEKYNLPAYLMQSLDLTKDRVEGTFGKEKEKQEGLNKWFS